CCLTGLLLIYHLCPGGMRAQPYAELLRKPVLPEEARRSMMYSYVDRNLPTMELPSSKAAWDAGRPRLLSEIRRLVGLSDLEQRAPLRWVSKGVLDRDTYTIEKILYESYPGMMVPALVYTPKGLKAAAPAMVSIPGHEYCEGKAAMSVQARSVNLVHRGIIVLSYDYIGTFERNTGANPCAGMPYGGGNDHGIRTFSYTGRNPTGLEILDGVRAIDYLYTRKDVDRNRIGFTGESGGSNSTYWVAAIDERVRLAVPVASVTTFEYWIRNNGNWDWHQRPAGIRAVAELSSLLALIAPRPLLVISSLRGTDAQEFPLDEARKAVDQAKLIYTMYGVPGNIQLSESSTSHGYQTDKREHMYGWVERHFLRQGTSISRELPFSVEPIEHLRCGLPPENKTLAQIYQEWLQETRRVTTDAAALRGRLTSLLGLSAPGHQPVLSVQTTSSRADALVRHWIVHGEAGISLPGVEYTPRSSVALGTVILLGRTTDLADAIEPLLARKLRAVFLDVRGTGEMDSGGGRTDNWAWFTGHPWPGMWVRDIQDVVSAILEEHGRAPVGLMAPSANFGKAALFTTALDARISAIHARLPFVSYRAEAQEGGLADVPRVLPTLDLPEAAALVAPRSCWLEFAASASPESIRATYRPAAEAIARGEQGDESFRALPAGARSWDKIADWFSRQLNKSAPGNQ
ncbi:MAG TPA: hypothetical protein VM120_05215, partial [Bryobacteraceae bacterium]|nr:hypothetical protein [Bryobacteraceae bacterium]